MDYHLLPLGDNAITIELGSKIDLDIQKKVQTIINLLDEKSPQWLIEYIPAFTTVTLFYNPIYISNTSNSNVLPYNYVCDLINQLLSEPPLQKQINPHTVEIPVCYGNECGPDLDYVAEVNGLSIDDVISIHLSGEYHVYMIGFSPGFPFIGGMSEKIAAPRRSSPRLKIPAGSVGIAGMQTGIYPIETPGGWQLIGRTPIKLFRPDKPNPSLIKAGDKIHFTRISIDEYIDWGRGDE